jgi:hypothetical protein
MTNLFNNLIHNTHSLTSSSMNIARDMFREYLFSCYNENFPRYGPRLVDITDIINLIDINSIQPMIVVCSCTMCGYNRQVPIALRIIYIPTPDLWASNAPKIGQSIDALSTTSEIWFKILLQHALNQIGPNEAAVISQHGTPHELHCNHAIQQTIYFENNLPSSWTIEINPQLQPKTIPALTLQLRTSRGEQSYYLRTIIYTGSQHFTARLIIEGSIWNYDSAKNNGKPYFCTTTGSSEWSAEQLLHYEGRDMYQLIYSS